MRPQGRPKGAYRSAKREGTTMNPFEPRVIVALDFSNPMHALALADRLDPAACGVMIRD